MIEVSNQDVNSRNLNQAMQKLYHTVGLGWQQAQRIATICKAMQKQMDAIFAWRKPLLEKHCKMQDGEPLTTPQGDLIFLSPEDQETYRVAHEQKMAETFEVPSAKLSFREIGNLKCLTPGELEAVSALCDGVPDPNAKNPGAGLVLPKGLIDG